MTSYEEQRLDKLEKRQDKLEDKVNIILQEISSFKPILNEINKNIERLSDNSIDKDRIIKLEDKISELEQKIQEETINKKARLLEEIIKYIVLALVGILIGYFGIK